MLDWIFDAIETLWNGFWNVLAKLFGSFCLAAVIALAVTAGAKILTDEYELATAVFIGGLCAAVKLLINEVGVPLVWAQEKRERERRSEELEALIRANRRR